MTPAAPVNGTGSTHIRHWEHPHMAPGAPTYGTGSTHVQHQAGRPRGRALREATPLTQTTPIHRPAPSPKPRPHGGPAPPRPVPPGPGGGGGAGSGGGSAAWMRRGECVVLPGRAGGCRYGPPRVTLSPLSALFPAAFLPRSAPLRAAEGSRSVRVRRVPKFPAALRAGSGAAGRPALLPRCYRAAGPAAPGDLRGRFVASGPGGRRKSRPRGVTVPRPFGHRRGFPLSSGGVSGSSVTPWGTPGRVCCAVLPERFAPPSHKCPVRPFGSLCHERFGILSGSLCRGRFRSPFTAGALGCFTTLEHKRFGVFREPFFLGGGLFGRPFLGGPFGHGCLEVHWDPQRCCCAPAERRWLQWELHPELLELWAGRGCKPQHGGGAGRVMPK